MASTLSNLFLLIAVILFILAALLPEPDAWKSRAMCFGLAFFAGAFLVGAVVR